VSETAGDEPDIIWLDSVGSTNAEAMKLLAEGRMSPVWMTAREQTAGRGGRNGSGHRRQAIFTQVFCCRCPVLHLEQLSCLSLVAGLAVADSFVASGVNAPVTLKWPNDVLVDAARLRVSSSRQQGRRNPGSHNRLWGEPCPSPG
jgi:BirA family biotin operon repressor/biotin-[acetyl-CoA-carboxylase] ligase